MTPWMPGGAGWVVKNWTWPDGQSWPVKTLIFLFDHPPVAPVAHSCIGPWGFVPVCQMVQYTSEPDDLAARWRICVWRCCMKALGHRMRFCAWIICTWWTQIKKSLETTCGTVSLISRVSYRCEACARQFRGDSRPLLAFLERREITRVQQSYKLGSHEESDFLTQTTVWF